MEQTTHKDELQFFKQMKKYSQIPVSQKPFIPSPLRDHETLTQVLAAVGAVGVVSTRGDQELLCAGPVSPTGSSWLCNSPPAAIAEAISGAGGSSGKPHFKKGKTLHSRVRKKV